MSIQIIGVDPGLVHTGLVSLQIDKQDERVFVGHEVLQGIDAQGIRNWCDLHSAPFVFVEKYRPRKAFGTDERMVKGEAAIKQAVPRAILLDNTGVRRVVTPPVLQALDLWKFSTSTHHDDLRSAARIAVLGMMKRPQLNELLADIIRDEIDGTRWEFHNAGRESAAP